MSSVVRFNGSIHTDRGTTHPVREYGWEFNVGDTKVFDSHLCAEHNRFCGETDDERERCAQEHDGSCWAQLFCATYNIGPDQKRVPPPFTCDAVDESMENSVNTGDDLQVVIEQLSNSMQSFASAPGAVDVTNENNEQDNGE